MHGLKPQTEGGTARPRWLTGAFLLLAVLVAAGPTEAGARASLSPRHKKWLEEEVVYIISDEEKKLFRSLPTDAERDQFIEHFWQLRDPTPATPENEYKEEHYRRIAYADQHYSEGRGEYGWAADRGRVYIMLGPPAQTTKYVWQGSVRPTEIWFYSNTHPSLPGFFNVVFFQPDDASDYRLYSPVIDGPTKLAKGSGIENNPQGAYRQLYGISAELARVSLTLLTDEPIDTENFTASMASDALLTRIFNLPNDHFTREMLERRQQLREVVKTRVSFEPGTMQVQWVPLRDPDGDTSVHLMLLVPATLAEMAGQAEGQYVVAARVNILVRTFAGEQLFQQTHADSYPYEAKDFERLKDLPFAYEDKLPLPAGDYDVDFVFHNETTRNYYLARQRLTVPPLAGDLGLSPPVPYEEAVRAERNPVALPFEFFDIRFVPSARQEWGRAEKLRVFFQIYLPQPGSSYHEGDTLRVEYTLGTPAAGGPRKTEAEEIAKREFDEHGTVLHGKGFDLNQLAPGAYRLVVKVTDPATNGSAAQTLTLKVVPLQGEKGRATIRNARLAEDLPRGWLDYRRGLCEAGQNRLALARRYLERALERNPQLEAARARLATILFRQGEYQQVARLAPTLRITADTPLDSVSALLASLERTGALGRAVEFGEQALAVLPPSAGLYEKMAVLYEKSGRAERAGEMREQARRLTEPQKQTKGESQR